MRRWRRLNHELIRERKLRQRVEASHREGIDASWGRPDPQALLDAGKTFICGYLSAIPGLAFTGADMKRYSEAGLDIVCIYERAQEAPKGGARVGRKHARGAEALAHAAGVPRRRPIMFAVDFEATGPEVAAYFIGLNAVLGYRDYEVGVYGSRTVCDYLLDNGLVDFVMQTYAWSHHEWDERAGLRQWLIWLPDEPLEIGGAKVDYCKSKHLDFGQFKVAA